MKLTLLRHGETEGSRRDLYYGAADIPALPESLAAPARKRGGRIPGPPTTTSGLLRTIQTLGPYTATWPHTRRGWCCRGCGRWISATSR